MLKNIDLNDLEELKVNIRTSLYDILKPAPGQATLFDEEMIINETLNYVFRDSPQITMANRYEVFYALLGKSVSIAQGWKLNCSESVKAHDQSYKSIVNYIENTYGIHREDY